MKPHRQLEEPARHRGGREAEREVHRLIDMGNSKLKKELARNKPRLRQSVSNY